MKIGNIVGARARVSYCLTGPDGTVKIPWTKKKHNYILDQGLLNMAKVVGSGSGSLQNLMSYCHLGSSAANPSFQSAGTTLSCTGTAVTLTGGSSVFPSNCAGGVIKVPGVGDIWIQTYNSATSVTAYTSQSIAGTTSWGYYPVQQTQLQTPISGTGIPGNTYVAGAGNNFTSYSASTLTHQRTWLFNTGTAYTVNEIGWAADSIATHINGRFVTASTINVGMYDTLQVQIQVQYNFAPATPTAVGNVGTNVNTAGNAMWEALNSSYISASGSGNFAPGVSIDGTNLYCAYLSATYTQNSAIATTVGSDTAIATTAGFTCTAPNAGLGTWTTNAAPHANPGLTTGVYTSNTVVSGFTCYGISLTNGSTKTCFDIKFTTPFTVPAGNLASTITWTFNFTRNLLPT